MINKQKFLKMACLVSVAVLLGACSSQEIASPSSDDMQTSTPTSAPASVAPQTANWEKPQVVTTPAPIVVPAPIIVTEPAVVVTRPAVPVVKPSVGAASYMVKKGDTVYEVMRQTGVYWKEIINLNNLQAPSYTIRPGQTLRLK